MTASAPGARWPCGIVHGKILLTPFKKVLVVIRESLSLARGVCGLSLDGLLDWMLGGDLVPLPE